MLEATLIPLQMCVLGVACKMDHVILTLRALSGVVYIHLAVWPREFKYVLTVR